MGLNYQDRELFDNFDLRVPLGMIPGAVRVSKFSKATATAVTQDLWNRAHDMTYLFTGTQLYIVSSSESDTQKYVISGTDENGDFINEIVTATGTTPKALSSLWKRVWRVAMYQQPASSGANVGNIFISTKSTEGTPLDTEIQAYIAAGEKQTYMSHFTVPKGYVGLVKSYTASVGSGKEAVVTPEARTNGYVFLPVTEDRRYQSVFQNDTYYFLMPPEWDLRIRVQSESAGTAISFPYTIFLIPESYWNPQTLEGNYYIDGVLQNG